MLEIKIQCDCGQKFKFDVEPVQGRMPYTVACPICGMDGTPKANEALRQRLSTAAAPLPVSAVTPVMIAPPPAAAPKPFAPAPVAVPAVAFAAAPPAPAPMAVPPPPPPPPSGGGLRISKEAHAPAPVAVAAAPAAPPPAPGGYVNPMAARAQAQAAAAADALTPKKKPSFALGLGGALTGAVIGGLIYFVTFLFIPVYLRLPMKLLAVGVGYLTGFGAEFLGRKEGSKELGMIAGALTVCAIIGAQYFAVLHWYHSGEGGDNKKPAVAEYDAQVAYAKKMMAAIPTGSDHEIQLFLASDELEPGKKPDPASVTPDDIAAFRATVLPEMKDLASGKITREAFNEKLKQEEAAAKDNQVLDGEDSFKVVFGLMLLSKFNLFSMAAAAGLAFKVCSNA